MTCTVAYPYMNGRLHIGHAMTIVNADVAVRFARQNKPNEDIIFPFGFHCTGMPIYASAMKLSQGDVDVRKSLLDMGISESSLDKFKDPTHWVETFPRMAMDDLKGMNLAADFSRSFVTTDVNPYYDSMIRWQYCKLFEQGHLSYESRPCIYSIKDNQPCADHDRQSGEGVKPAEYYLYHKGGKFVVVERMSSRLSPEGALNSMKADTAVKVLNNGKTYHGLMPEYWYLCLKYQGLSVQIVTEPIQEHDEVIHNTEISVWFADHVVSRTGDICIVAKVPQWYVNYGNPIWKEKVRTTLNKMTIHNPEVRKQLHISVDRMDDWCISREYGLGTRLPNDPKFLIDSLSDSTIYMAYYTVCHLLHRDIYGRDQIVPIDLLDNSFWDGIFGISDYTGPVPIDQVLEMSEQFKKYYPPKLRVSGKDLIYNHLIMSIYQHIAIFGDDVFCQEYLINGYAKLNGAKMSKSTGNFITIADALAKYRVDALRVMLVESGDGLEDSNIRLKEYNNICSALDLHYSQNNDIVVPAIWDQVRSLGPHSLYLDMILYCYRDAHLAFTRGRYREAMTLGWRKCQKVMNTYLKIPDYNPQVVQLSRIISHVVMAPILGQKVKYPVPSWVTERDIDESVNGLYEFLLTLVACVRKNTKGKEFQGIEIKIHRTLACHETKILEHLKLFYPLWQSEIVYDDGYLHPKRDPLKLKPVVTLVR